MAEHPSNKTSYRVLVVGGAGYIGSHVCRQLQAKGHTPIVIDNLSTGHKESIDCEFYEGEASDHELIGKIAKKHQIDTVMHFAAKALVAESIADPLLYYQTNGSETVRLLQALEKNNIKRFIFSSTCATFGIPSQVPITETEKQDPVNPYGQSKLVIEMMLRDLCRFKGFQATVLRYFNAAGADIKGDIGEDHLPETHLIPLALRAALTKKPLTVFGNDYATPDGTCVRDYIHVNDLAEAHILAMNGLQQTATPKYEHYNLGSEKGYSVFEIVKTIKNVTRLEVPYVMGERRPGDPPTLVADSTKARKALGWTCKHDLNSIISTAFAFMKNHSKGV